MTTKKSKPAWLFILMLLWSLLAGCAEHMTYDEMTDAHAAAVDPEEKQRLLERIERFEATAERAHEEIAFAHSCMKSPGVVWFCPNQQSSNHRFSRREMPQGIDEVVKLWRRYYRGCHCVRAEDMQL